MRPCSRTRPHFAKFAQRWPARHFLRFLQSRHAGIAPVLAMEGGVYGAAAPSAAKPSASAIVNGPATAGTAVAPTAAGRDGAEGSPTTDIDVRTRTDEIAESSPKKTI